MTITVTDIAVASEMGAGGAAAPPPTFKVGGHHIYNVYRHRLLNEAASCLYTSKWQVITLIVKSLNITHYG